ncbi:hypothetical protein OX283_003860 [Flavobacterium sp. SUN052]|uniref:hypothetical protein n=1 Tax=Flavobacterium sp. SUN052 TaxID=3002441 RepID=UPI00237D68AA|nr:hypothetical protein [Flavobacterium sp. SUN052]MEC4003780.1 hypothetical protein [Flavobacterium sp. SUN052]
MNQVLLEIKDNKKTFIMALVIYCLIVSFYMFKNQNDFTASILTSTLHLFFFILFASLFNIKSILLTFLSWIALIPWILVVLFRRANRDLISTLITLAIIIIIFSINYYLKKKQTKQT